MRKYRIVELRFGFYPQEKWLFYWKYIDNLHGGYICGEKNKAQSKCDTLTYAKYCIERRKEWLNNGDTYPIYHEIK